jgi:soluble P-type ATPase
MIRILAISSNLINESDIQDKPNDIYMKFRKVFYEKSKEQIEKEINKSKKELQKLISVLELLENDFSVLEKEDLVLSVIEESEWEISPRRKMERNIENVKEKIEMLISLLETSKLNELINRKFLQRHINDLGLWCDEGGIV